MNRWISVETTLRPKEGEEVLVTNGNDVALAKYEEISWTLSKQLHVTHWMRLPDLPSVEYDFPNIPGVDGVIIDTETNGHVAVMVALNEVRFQKFYKRDDAKSWLRRKTREIQLVQEGLAKTAEPDDPILKIKCPVCSARQKISESMMHGTLKCSCCETVSDASEWIILRTNFNGD